jgi:hypothetical protein
VSAPHDAHSGWTALDGAVQLRVVDDTSLPSTGGWPALASPRRPCRPNDGDRPQLSDTHIVPRLSRSRALETRNDRTRTASTVRTCRSGVPSVDTRDPRASPWAAPPCGHPSRRAFAPPELGSVVLVHGSSPWGTPHRASPVDVCNRTRVASTTLGQPEPRVASCRSSRPRRTEHLSCATRRSKPRPSHTRRPDLSTRLRRW